MAQITQTQLQIIIDAQNKASAVLRDVAGDTDKLSNKASGLSQAFNGALGAIASYAGSRGIGMLITAYQESSLQTAQARFFLAGFTKDIDGSLASMQEFGDRMQRTTGVSGEYATLVASKLMPRLKDMNKAREYATVLLKGERLGVLDASSTANMMMKATEGNEKAMKMLLEQLGLSVPKFASMDSMMAILNGRLDEGLKGLDPLTEAWKKLKENFGDIAETAGKPIVVMLAGMAEWVNKLIQSSPALQQAIGGAFTAISVGLLGLGAGKSLEALGVTLAGNSVAWGLWGLGVGLAIGGTIYYLSQLDSMTTQTKENWMAGLMLMAGVSALVGTAIASTFFLPLSALLSALVIATSMSIEGYELSWKGFKSYLSDTWEGIKIIARETWTYMLGWLSTKMEAGIALLMGYWDKFSEMWGKLWQGIKDAINAPVQYILDKINAIISAVQSAISMMSKIGVSAGSAVSAVANFAGFRANGGQVTAGSTYVVGERGAELFTPSANGFITPNGALGGSGGVTVVFNNPTVLNEEGARMLMDISIDAFSRSHQFGL